MKPTRQFYTETILKRLMNLIRGILIKAIPYSIIFMLFSCEENNMVELESIPNENIDTFVEEAFPNQTGTTKVYHGTNGSFCVEEINGHHVLEGDILLTEEQIEQLANQENSSDNARVKANLRASLARRWPNGIVYYEIAHESVRARVEWAINHIEENSYFTFVLRTNQPNYISFEEVDRGCSSHYGMTGNKQFVKLAPGCGNGPTVHEICHALGFWHEQSRPDRHDYITIHWDNIEDDKLGNFVERDGNVVGNGEFDFNSIMMYGPYSFSKNGQPTITIVGGGLYTANRSCLSAGDITGLLGLYSKPWQFILNTGTALGQTDNNFEFVLAENRDLFAIKKSNTGSNSTELHVLSASSNYQSFNLHTGTALGEADDTFEFAIAQNRDIFAIKKTGTGTNSTELHVLSASSGYQSFVLQTGTSLSESNDYDFVVAKNRDLIAIQEKNNPGGKIGVRVLTAASGYTLGFLAGTQLPETTAGYDFTIAENRDLIAVKKSGTGTNSTEIYTLSAASSYTQTINHVGTALHETNDSYAFAMAKNRDLFTIKKNGTGSNSTEVHVLRKPAVN